MAMSKLKLKKIKVSDKADVMEVPSMRMFPPSFHVDALQMPEIKDWEAGEKYKLVIEVNMSSKSDNKRGTSADLEVTAYKELKKKRPDQMDDEEFGEHQGDVMSGKEKL